MKKYCKAWLVKRRVDFPWTHDLEALAKLCLPSLAGLAVVLADLYFLRLADDGRFGPGYYVQRLAPTPIEKGIGELPTVAAPVAVANAIMDTLCGVGVRHLDTPLTAEKIWHALHGVEEG